MNTQIQTESNNPGLRQVSSEVDCQELLGRAQVLMDAGLVSPAAELYQRILEQEENAEARQGAGRCAYLRGELHEALGHFQRIDEGRSLPGLQNDLGVIYFELGLVEQAHAQLEKAATQCPEDVVIWRNLLDIAISREDRVACRIYCDQVLALDPSDKEVRGLLQQLG
jgi:tetratricopeptide (TPR) repeat protein